jgi:dTMP kinase
MAERGVLVVFEGLDQSGKQTQAEALRDWCISRGRSVRLLSFPTYRTPLGTEIGRALRGERDYGADVMQLLYVANRFEWKPDIARELSNGTVLVCDRYRASSVAYGEAHGLDARWLESMQEPLPAPDLTILLDMAPEVSLARKQAGRDKYERDLDLLGRVRQSYLRQAQEGQWIVLDAVRDRSVVAGDVRAAVAPFLSGTSVKRAAPGPSAP